MWCGIEWVEWKEFSLHFYIDRDGDYSLSDNLALGGDWLPVDAENYRTTASGLCPLEAGHADPTRLANAAYEALDLVLQNLNGPVS